MVKNLNRKNKIFINNVEYVKIMTDMNCFFFMSSLRELACLLDHQGKHVWKAVLDVLKHFKWSQM